MPPNPNENVLQDHIPTGGPPVLKPENAAAELSRPGQVSGHPEDNAGQNLNSDAEQIVIEVTAELAQRTVQLEKLQRELARATQTHSGAERHRRERDGNVLRLGAELDRSHRAAEEIAPARTREADDISVPCAKPERPEEHRAETRILAAQVTRLASEHAALSEALTARSQVIGHLENQVEQLRADRSEHMTALAQGRAELARLQDLLDERETQLRASEAGLADAHAELENAQEATAAAELQHAEHLEHIASLEDQLETSAELADALARLQRKREALEAATESAEENQRELEDELLEQRRLIKQLRQAQTQLDRNLVASETRRQDQDVLIGELRRHIRDKDEQLKQLRNPRRRDIPARDALRSAALGSGEALSHTTPDNRGRTRLLIWVSGDQEVRCPLSKDILTIGRTGDNDIQLDTHCVSRKHARLVSADGETFIEDLNSKNGVYVNALRVARERLRPGDHVTIGETALRYVIVPIKEH